MAAWRHHRSQPLTDAQHATLSALVGTVTTITGKSYQKVWADLHFALNVRKKTDLTQKDFDKARDLLLQELR